MAGAVARDYAYAQPRVRPQAPKRPDLQVIPGRGSALAERIGASPLFFTILKVVVAGVIFIAAVGVCRVALTSASVNTLIASDDLTAQISTARSLSSDLEVQQSSLSNPSRIKEYASSTLGMSSSDTSEQINLADGALSTDSNGTLSLAGSVDVLEASSSSSTTQTAETSTNVSAA